MCHSSRPAMNARARRERLRRGPVGLCAAEGGASGACSASWSASRATAQGATEGDATRVRYPRVSTCLLHLGRIHKTPRWTHRRKPPHSSRRAVPRAWPPVVAHFCPPVRHTMAMHFAVLASLALVRRRRVGAFHAGGVRGVSARARARAAGPQRTQSTARATDTADGGLARGSKSGRCRSSKHSLARSR